MQNAFSVYRCTHRGYRSSFSSVCRMHSLYTDTHIGALSVSFFPRASEKTRSEKTENAFSLKREDRECILSEARRQRMHSLWSEKTTSKREEEQDFSLTENAFSKCLLEKREDRESILSEARRRRASEKRSKTANSLCLARSLSQRECILSQREVLLLASAQEWTNRTPNATNLSFPAF